MAYYKPITQPPSSLNSRVLIFNHCSVFFFLVFCQEINARGIRGSCAGHNKGRGSAEDAMLRPCANLCPR